MPTEVDNQHLLCPECESRMRQHLISVKLEIPEGIIAKSGDCVRIIPSRMVLVALDEPLPEGY